MDDICKTCAHHEVCTIREAFYDVMRRTGELGISNDHHWNKDGTIPLGDKEEPRTVVGIIKCWKLKGERDGEN